MTRAASAAAVSALIGRLGRGDPKVRNLAVMDLTRLADDARAREALWEAYCDPATPARVAHAAILAHDRAAAESARRRR